MDSRSGSSKLSNSNGGSRRHQRKNTKLTLLLTFLLLSYRRIDVISPRSSHQSWPPIYPSSTCINNFLPTLAYGLQFLLPFYFFQSSTAEVILNEGSGGPSSTSTVTQSSSGIPSSTSLFSTSTSKDNNGFSTLSSFRDPSIVKHQDTLESSTRTSKVKFVEQTPVASASSKSASEGSKSEVPKSKAAKDVLDKMVGDDPNVQSGKSPEAADNECGGKDCNIGDKIKLEEPRVEASSYRGTHRGE